MIMEGTTEYLTEIERNTDYYLERIRKIDLILEAPVKTLIRIASEVPDAPWSCVAAEDSCYFPAWISEDIKPHEADHLLTQSLCCATLQRLWRIRRRFNWLDKLSRAKLGEVHKKLVLTLIPKDKSQFENHVLLLQSPTFGGLNPLTASQVFRVLLDAGEAHTHCGMGFLAFFAMVWPLYRRFPDPVNIGAPMEPWGPSAYVTANCILPIKTLQMIAKRRAGLLEKVAGNLEVLRPLAAKDGQRERWRFSVGLDDLSTSLFRLSEVAINGEVVRACARTVGEKADETTAGSLNSEIYREVLRNVAKTLRSVGDKSKPVLAQAENVVDWVDKEIVKRLGTDKKGRNQFEYLEKRWGIRFAKEYINNDKFRDDYRRDINAAAEKAVNLCRRALHELNESSRDCQRVREESEHAEICDRLKSLAGRNRKIADFFDGPLQDPARWCRTVVDREIAYASAQNITDFDPCELVSAIAVSVREDLMTTPLQVSDALSKALAGVRPDGSWSSGQPFYSPNHSLGIWATTSDIVWTLTSAIEQYPDVAVADEKLFLYVDWLERTRTTLRWKPDQSACGWASDRLRHRQKIHLATTAYSINALLEIRDLAEYRLWKLCEKRFSVFSRTKSLKEIEPVDLGAKHKHRLHSRLAHMVRQTQGPDYAEAEYSLVLHGPPGSSKTSIVQALSADMWKVFRRWGPKVPRLIRITPADFTRLGEDRLDSEAAVIFELLSGIRGVTIFFDEIDDLLRQRSSAGASPRFMDLVVPAMLNRLADLREACPGQELCFLLATNYIDHIEPALIRKGRVDTAVTVTYPDWQSRLAMIGRHIEQLLNRKGEGEFLGLILGRHEKEVAGKTARWPWMTIEATCNAIEKGLEKDLGARRAADSAGLARRMTDPGQRDSLLDSFREEIGRTIAENESTFSKPDYKTRWEKRFCRELLNEWFHFLIAISTDWEDCKQNLLMDKQTVGKIIESGEFVEKEELVAALMAMWSKEERNLGATPVC
jgi:hypothetical protein